MFAVSLFGAARIFSQEQLCILDDSKAVQLLSYIATENGPISTSYVSKLIWGAVSEAEVQLQATIDYLTQAVGPIIQEHALDQTLYLAQDVYVDVQHCEQLLATGTLSALQEALELYQGTFWDDEIVCPTLELSHWIDVKRTYWRTRITHVLQKTVWQLDYNKHFAAEILMYITKYLTIDPFNEMMQYQAITQYQQLGQFNKALCQLKAYEELLSQTGKRPAAYLQALGRQLRQQHAQTTFRHPKRSPPTCSLAKADLKLELYRLYLNTPLPHVLFKGCTIQA